MFFFLLCLFTLDSSCFSFFCAFLPLTALGRFCRDTDGLLEPRPVTESADRVWNYVAVGCGKDLQWWKEFFSVCHMMGYDGDVSLEMEDLTMTVDAGVNTSIDALRQTISQ